MINLVSNTLTARSETCSDVRSSPGIVIWNPTWLHEGLSIFFLSLCCPVHVQLVTCPCSPTNCVETRLKKTGKCVVLGSGLDFE